MSRNNKNKIEIDVTLRNLLYITEEKIKYDIDNNLITIPANIFSLVKNKKFTPGINTKLTVYNICNLFYNMCNLLGDLKCVLKFRAKKSSTLNIQNIGDIFYYSWREIYVDDSRIRNNEINCLVLDNLFVCYSSYYLSNEFRIPLILSIEMKIMEKYQSNVIVPKPIKVTYTDANGDLIHDCLPDVIESRVTKEGTRTVHYVPLNRLRISTIREIIKNNHSIPSGMFLHTNNEFFGLKIEFMESLKLFNIRYFMFTYVKC